MHAYGSEGFNMPFFVIAGKFHCVNYSPDGDTIRFAPNDLSELALLQGVPAKVNARGHTSVRVEAIDALETHYGGRHQPLALANEARNALLAFLGISDVVWDSNQSSVVSARDGIDGYILARATDKFGRIIAFLYPGAPSSPSGSDVFVRPAMLDASLNQFMLSEGLAFPTYYQTLFGELRTALTQTVQQARAANRGVYAVDRTNTLSTIENIGSLTETLVLMPKLFRRASDYVAEAGSIRGFKDALELNEEPVLDLVELNYTHFDTFIEEVGDQIRLTRKPEDLVFDPMPERPGGEFRAMVNEIEPAL